MLPRVSKPIFNAFTTPPLAFCEERRNALRPVNISHLSDTAKGWVDLSAASLAGLAVFSVLQQIAVIVTILAGLGSLSLVGLRWYDRIYGPKP
jgi:hypothetical protein